MISVWDTGHPYSATIVRRVFPGIVAAGQRAELIATSSDDGRPNPSVVYGILRGNERIIRRCVTTKMDWWLIDKGFFRPHHFKGYYRVGRRALQPRFSPSAYVDPSRWKNLRIKVYPWTSVTPKSHILVCPPTQAMAAFYGLEVEKWTSAVLAKLGRSAPNHPVRVRSKGTSVPLAQDFEDCYCVVTFSSNVAMEALVLGIPAIVEVGTVKDWNGLKPEDAGRDIRTGNREALFNFAASCQFRLDEFDKGRAWRLLRKTLG